MPKLTMQIGLGTSLILFLLGTGYLMILADIKSINSFVTMESTSQAALTAGIITLFSAIGLVILMGCITEYAAPEKRVLGVIGLSFTILFAAVVSINRFAQLTIVRQSFMLADTNGLERFLPYGSRSVFFSLEMLGWGGFLSLATLSVAPIFTSGKLERWIATLFLIYSMLGTTSVLGYAFHSPIILVGFIAWGPVLGGAVILLGFLFWRDFRTQRKNTQSIRSSIIQS